MPVPQNIPDAELVVFSLDAPRYALPMAVAERVVRAVAITPLPRAPEIVLGIISVAGQVVPVVDIRRLLGLAPRPPRLDDRLLLARTQRRRVALLVDDVQGLRRLPSRLPVGGQELTFASYLEGVAELPDGLILIYDLDRFLSLEQERQLDAALAERQ